MRPKGAWIAICLILLVGVSSTNYVKMRQENLSSKVLVLSSGDEDDFRMSKEVSSLADSATDVLDKIPVTEETETGSFYDGMADLVADENQLLNRLQELDDQIARNRSRETEATAISQKTLAESEWTLWEAELQRILVMLKESLDPEEQEILMQQQKEWMRSRESQAVDAAKNQMGSTMEEVNYNRSLADLTRARVYELAKDYGAELSQ